MPIGSKGCVLGQLVTTAIRHFDSGAGTSDRNGTLRLCASVESESTTLPPFESFTLLCVRP